MNNLVGVREVGRIFSSQPDWLKRVLLRFCLPDSQLPSGDKTNKYEALIPGDVKQDLFSDASQTDGAGHYVEKQLPIAASPKKPGFCVCVFLAKQR